jgi:lipopolysaccharide export system permease protein
MKTLHLYLTRQVLASVTLTVTVFTFVLLLGNMMKEVLALLVNHQVGLDVVFQAIGLLIPFVLVHALPLGMLTATLLVFGRFSADQELTAARASGVSLLSLATPVLLTSVAMSCLCALINLQVAPACRVAYKQLFYKASLEAIEGELPEGRFIQDFPGYVIYAGKVRGTNLEDVLVYQLDNGEKVMDIRAEKATMALDRASNMIQFHFSQVVTFSRQANESVLATTTNSASTNVTETNLTNTASANWQQITFGSCELAVPLRSISQADAEPRISDMSRVQLLTKAQDLRALGMAETNPVEARMLRQVDVQLHRQVAYSFACIGFTLVGIPLGIRVHRRETSVGVAVAILLVAVYYGLTLFAQSTGTRSPHGSLWLMWAPNFLFQFIGGALLWRANRGI